MSRWSDERYERPRQGGAPAPALDPASVQVFLAWVADRYQGGPDPAHWLPAELEAALSVPMPLHSACYWPLRLPEPPPVTTYRDALELLKAERAFVEFLDDPYWRAAGASQWHFAPLRNRRSILPAAACEALGAPHGTPFSKAVRLAEAAIFGTGE